MTLALLLTAVTGAWAADTYTVTFAANGNTKTVENVTLPKTFQCSYSNANGELDLILKELYGWTGDKSETTCASWSTPTSSDANKVVAGKDNDGHYITIDNVFEGTITITGDYYVNNSLTSYSIEISIAALEPAIEVTPGEAANTWTFEMPASDVVLTPIYSAATISHAAGTPDASETPFETLKEAFANVKNGDVIKLDWNVTLTETLETLHRNGAINFTLDLNGYIIDGMTPEYAIRLRNGDLMTITDSSLGQTGGLKCQDLFGEQDAKFIFDGGRYTMGQLTADFLNTVCSKATAALLLADGKEFIDLEGGAEANDGFMVRVDWKTFELTIGPKKFATFYADKNIKFAEQPAEGVGLYTISSIDAGRSTATVTPISGIIPAGTPMLVYNGTEQKQTAKLIVTLDNAQGAVDWATQFKGTATDLEFTAGDMAAADYYALSGGKAFAPVKGAGILGANQCWLQFDKQEKPSARQFTLVFDSEATGIKTTDCTDYTDSVWYDLNGRKVAAPTKKGLYIMNGKKVVVK